MPEGSIISTLIKYIGTSCIVHYYSVLQVVNISKSRCYDFLQIFKVFCITNPFKEKFQVLNR